MIQFFDKNLNRAMIEASLKKDEMIVCENATVIANKDGKITGWINNDVPLCIFEREEENAE